MELREGWRKVKLKRRKGNEMKRNERGQTIEYTR